MPSWAKLKQLVIEALLSNELLTPEERQFYLEWDRNQVEMFGGTVCSVGIIVIGLSLLPVYFFAPEPHRLIEFSTHVVFFILLLIAKFWAYRNHRDPRLLFMLMELTMLGGYAACARLCFASTPSLNDVAFLPTMLATICFFSILLFPFSNASVLIGTAVYWCICVWALAGYKALVLQHWAGILAVGCGFSICVFRGRVNHSRGQALVELKARQLLVQNERLRVDAINKELEIAREIQDSLRPPASLLTAGDWRVAFFQIKFDALGGDWMAARQMPNGELILVVADATGKGVQAALIVHAVQSLWANTLDDQIFAPMQWLASVNRTLYELGRRKEHTMSLGILVLRGELLSYYSAGHTPVFLVGSAAAEFAVNPIVGRGSLLGIAKELAVEPRHVDLSKGDTESVLLGTDGVFDKGVRTRKKAITMMLADVELHGTQALRNCPAEDDKLLIWMRRQHTAAQIIGAPKLASSGSEVAADSRNDPKRSVS